MYKDFCRHTEVYKPVHKYIYTGPCVVTEKMVTVEVLAEELFALNQGEYIQDALKSNTPDEREFLLTGMSKEGWDLMMKEEEEE